MPDAAGPRFNVAILKDDGTDSMTAYRTDLRALEAAIESLAAVYGEGLLSARPAFGAHGRFYKPTDAGLETVIYYDDGTAWRTIGAAALIDAAAAVGSLRTLGAGAQQAAAGNHQHGAGDLISGSIPAGRYGTTTVPVAAIDASGTPSGVTFLRGDGVWGAIDRSYAEKSADLTRVSGAFNADPDLQVSLTAGTWLVDVWIRSVVNGFTNYMGWDLNFSGTASTTTGLMTAWGYDNAAGVVKFAVGANPLVSPGLIRLGDTSRDDPMHVHARISVSASGTLAFRWAVNANTVGHTITLSAGSHITATRVA